MSQADLLASVFGGLAAGQVREKRVAPVPASSALKMHQTIAKAAQARGYNVIFDVSQIAYVEPGLDLTSDASAAYGR